MGRVGSPPPHPFVGPAAYGRLCHGGNVDELLGTILDGQFAVQGGFALDRSNDPLNPTRGWRLQVEADPTYVTGDRRLPYLKLQGQVSGYLRFVYRTRA